MNHFKKDFYSVWLFIALVLVIFADTRFAVTQESRTYLRGENNTVEMIVHIIGQVQKPGTYRVGDTTNLIELMALAGGPTEFSNLRDVTITHLEADLLADAQNKTVPDMVSRIIKYDIKKYLTKDNISSPPVLHPGDVVLVPKNKWHKWRYIATIVRDVSVVATAYFLYLRATRD